MEDEQVRKVKDLEASKERLIHEYLELQDRADELNGRIYQLCCEIEGVNRQIEILHVPAPVGGPAAAPPAEIRKPNQIPPMA